MNYLARAARPPAARHRPRAVDRHRAAGRPPATTKNKIQNAMCLIRRTKQPKDKTTNSTCRKAETPHRKH